MRIWRFRGESIADGRTRNFFIVQSMSNVTRIYGYLKYTDNRNITVSFLTIISYLFDNPFLSEPLSDRLLVLHQE